MNKLERLAAYAGEQKDWHRVCEKAELEIPELADFLDTWASHCGAPRSVFVGHTVKMLIEAQKE